MLSLAASFHISLFCHSILQWPLSGICALYKNALMYHPLALVMDVMLYLHLTVNKSLGYHCLGSLCGILLPDSCLSLRKKPGVSS